MHVKQLLCISSYHRIIRAYGTWHDGGQYCGSAVSLNYTQNTKIDS